MDQPVTGSTGERGPLGPLDESKVWAMRFIQGIVTLNTMNEMSERIKMIEAMLDLPIIQSGSTMQAAQKKVEYTRELREIEEAIKLLCALTEVPEA